MGGDGYRTFPRPLADGSTATIDTGQTMDNGQVVPIQATVVVAPLNTAVPVIAGTPTVGQILSCSTGAWSYTPTSYAYQWLADGSALAGQTGATHTIAAADAGHALTCQVTATNPGGTASATSAATDPVKPGPPPAPMNSGLPAISGTARQFETLTTTPGLWTGGVSSFAYQWLRCATASGDQCVPVAGATTAAYPLTRDDIGSTMRVDVTAANANGATTARSAPSAVVQIGVITARLSVAPDPSCTGLTVGIDASGSVSPNGIAKYEIRLITLGGDGDYEGDIRNSAARDAFALLGGALPEYEIDQNTYATYYTPTAHVVFGWNRLEFPAYPGDPNGFKYFARDPVGIVLDVTDYAGATARAVSVEVFAQEYSNGSRSQCPSQPRFVTQLLRAKLVKSAASFVITPGKPATSRLAAALACTAAVACTGQLSVTVPASAACRSCTLRAAAKRRSARAPVVLARSFFTIAAHTKGTVVATLTPTGIRLLKGLRHGASARARVSITTVGPTGTTLAHASTLLLKRK